MTVLTTKMTGVGRIVVPIEVRKRLGLQEGETIHIEIDDDDTVRLSTPKHAIRRAQQLFRKHVPKGTSVVDEFIEDRRREGENE
jgi:AbrB family looped-hinge helix DNA binding protein